MKHLLGIEHLSAVEIDKILALAVEMKSGFYRLQPLAGQTWVLLFSKPSTRTRVSFEIGVNQLGGHCIYLSQNDMQWGRGELIWDTARVLSRMVHGAILRTGAQRDMEDFAHYSKIPTINALSSNEHPCQILADLFTMKEIKGELAPLRVAFIGDGNCNTARSLVWAAAKMNFHLSVASPKGYEPKGSWRALENMLITSDPTIAATDADVLYTDTFVSMGNEEETALRLADLGPYWINRELVSLASPDCIVMHPLPAHRGQEIATDVFEDHASTIFQQAENRIHVQKAILAMICEK